MSLAQKKKVMMTPLVADGPSTTPITGLTWALSTFISSSGNETTGSSTKYAATSDLYGTGSHKKLRYIGPASHDGTAINVFCHQYQGSTWKKRIGNLNSGAEFVLDAATTGIRFTFAYPLSASKPMTQDVVDAYAQFEWTD